MKEINIFTFKKSPRPRSFGGTLFLFGLIGPVFEIVAGRDEDNPWEFAKLKIGIAVNPFFELVLMLTTTWRYTQ